MTILRRFAAVVIALALTALAVPAMAQQAKTFALSGFDQFTTFGTDLWKEGEVRVINNSPTTKANYNSFRIFAPRGFKITVATPANNASNANSVTSPLPQYWTAQDANIGRSYVEVRGISPSIGNTGANTSFGLQLKVERGCAAVPTDYWTVQVYSGGDLGGAQFDYKSPVSPYPSLTFPTSTAAAKTDGECQPKVEFVPGFEPKNQLLVSGVAGITATANNSGTGSSPVKAQVMLGTQVNTGYSGSIVLQVSGPSSVTNPTSLTATVVNGVATFATPPQVSAVGRYSFVPTATGHPNGDSVNIMVSEKILKCVTYDGNGNPVYTDARVTFGSNVTDTD